MCTKISLKQVLVSSDQGFRIIKQRLRRYTLMNLGKPSIYINYKAVVLK